MNNYSNWSVPRVSIIPSKRNLILRNSLFNGIERNDVIEFQRNYKFRKIPTEIRCTEFRWTLSVYRVLCSTNHFSGQFHQKNYFNI